jgi:hypothetical protein
MELIVYSDDFCQEVMKIVFSIVNIILISGNQNRSFDQFYLK